MLLDNIPVDEIKSILSEIDSTHYLFVDKGSLEVVVEGIFTLSEVWNNIDRVQNSFPDRVIRAKTISSYKELFPEFKI